MFYFASSEYSEYSKKNPCGEDAPGPAGNPYRCTRPKNHPGYHAAHGTAIMDERLDVLPGEYRYVLAVWGPRPMHAAHPDYDHDDLPEVAEDSEHMSFHLMFPMFSGMDIHAAGHFLEAIGQAWITNPSIDNHILTPGITLGAAIASGMDDILPIIVTTDHPTEEEVGVVNKIYADTPLAKLVESAYRPETDE